MQGTAILSIGEFPVQLPGLSSSLGVGDGEKSIQVPILSGDLFEALGG